MRTWCVLFLLSLVPLAGCGDDHKKISDREWIQAIRATEAVVYDCLSPRLRDRIQLSRHGMTSAEGLAALLAFEKAYRADDYLPFDDNIKKTVRGLIDDTARSLNRCRPADARRLRTALRS